MTIVPSLRRYGFLAAMLLGATQARAIVTPFIDVDIGDVSPGHPTAVQGPGGEGLLIFNKEEDPVHVKVTAIRPQSVHRQGDEPIPDTAWIHIVPAELSIGPHQKAIFHIMVTVPSDAKWEGKKIETLLWTSLIPPGATNLQILGTLQSRLHFRVH